MAVYRHTSVQTAAFQIIDGELTVFIGDGDTTIYPNNTLSVQAIDTSGFTPSGGGGGSEAATVTMAADGWQATVSSPTDLSLENLTVQRAGFTSVGAATSFSEAVKLTKRVRQVYPSHASFTTDQVATSEYICAADSISGSTNNSTLVSPKPIAAWTMPHRLLVASEVDWEISAYHWAAQSGKQVACVRVRANNGSDQTAWQTASAVSNTSNIEDPNPLATYNGTIDVSSFAVGGFWLEAEVYPYVGTSASVLKSEDNNTASADPREFTRRYFRKGAVPAWVAVSSAGNDTSGAASATSEAAALSTPCLTVGGAINKLRTLFGAVTGSLDGCQIVIVDAVNMGTPAYQLTYHQDYAGLVITRATGTTRANAIVTISQVFRPYLKDHTLLNEGSIVFKDCTVKMGGAYAIQSETGYPVDVQFINCNINANSQTVSWRASGTALNYFGVVFTNFPTATSDPLGYTAAGPVRIMRGITCNLLGRGYEGWVTLGCVLTGVNGSTSKDYSVDGHIWANNTFLAPTPGNSPLAFHSTSTAYNGVDLGHVAVVQNLAEWTSTTSNAAILVCAGSGRGNLAHAVIHHNTIAGIEEHGRANIGYDETSGLLREHKFVSVKGNLFGQINVKGDVFITDGTHDGNYALIHGVACAGNFTRDETGGAPVSFAQAYPGIGSVIDGGDPLFTDYEAVTGTSASPVAGAGGGVYTLQAGSPARDILTDRLLDKDFADSSRGTGTQDAGCYA